MRIAVRNLRHERLCWVEVNVKNRPSVAKPVDGDGPDVYLHWDQAVDDDHRLRRCLVCGCRELFARKDFPQVTGLLIVVLAALVAMILFGTQRVGAGFVVLGLVALIDLVIYVFARRCLVCYRCRSEFRDLAIRREHPGWELATGEKYRVGGMGRRA